MADNHQVDHWVRVALQRELPPPPLDDIILYQDFQQSLPSTLKAFQENVVLDLSRSSNSRNDEGKLDTSALEREEHKMTRWRIDRAINGQVLDTRRHNTVDLTQIFLYLHLHPFTQQQDLERNAQILKALSVQIPDCSHAVRRRMWLTLFTARAVYPGGHVYNTLSQHHDDFHQAKMTVRKGVEWLVLLQNANIVRMVRCAVRGDRLEGDRIKAARNYSRFLSYLKDVLDVLETGLSAIRLHFVECVALGLANERDRRDAYRNADRHFRVDLPPGTQDWWETYLDHAMRHHGPDLVRRMGVSPPRGSVVSSTTTAEHMTDVMTRLALS
jgi:hypothetical protein